MNQNGYESYNAYSIKRQKQIKKRARKRRKTFLFIIVLILIIILGGKGIYKLIKTKYPYFSLSSNTKFLNSITLPDYVDKQIIHIHNTARTGAPVSKIKNIVIHYVGNPGSTAQNNRDYFDKNDTEVSSHFLVGLDGEIIQCIPLSEKSAATNWRNKDTISIEVCHPDESGKFNTKSYESVVKLTAWLCHELDLDETCVIRHYDVTGKLCPLYYVKHEDAWEQLKKDVKVKLDEYK